MTACSMLAPGSWVRPCRQYHGHAMALQVLLSPSDRFLYMQIPHLEHEVQQLKDDLKSHHSVCPSLVLQALIQSQNSKNDVRVIEHLYHASCAGKAFHAGMNGRDRSLLVCVFLYHLLPCRPQRCTG